MEIKSLKTKDYGSGFSLVDTNLINQLQADYKEAIEALRDIHDAQFNHSKSLAELNSTIRFTRKIIEKAYGEKWDKIRGKDENFI